MALSQASTTFPLHAYTLTAIVNDASVDDAKGDSANERATTNEDKNGRSPKEA